MSHEYRVIPKPIEPAQVESPKPPFNSKEQVSGVHEIADLPDSVKLILGAPKTTQAAHDQALKQLRAWIEAKDPDNVELRLQAEKILQTALDDELSHFSRESLREQAGQVKNWEAERSQVTQEMNDISKPVENILRRKQAELAARGILINPSIHDLKSDNFVPSEKISQQDAEEKYTYMLNKIRERVDQAFPGSGARIDSAAQVNQHLFSMPDGEKVYAKTTFESLVNNEKEYFNKRAIFDALEELRAQGKPLTMRDVLRYRDLEKSLLNLDNQIATATSHVRGLPRYFKGLVESFEQGDWKLGKDQVEADQSTHSPKVAA